jgi:hypothetical protein
MTASAATGRYQYFQIAIPVRAWLAISHPTHPAWTMVRQIPVLMNEPDCEGETSVGTAARYSGHTLVGDIDNKHLVPARTETQARGSSTGPAIAIID